MGSIVTEYTYDNLDDFFKDIVIINGKLYKDFFECSRNDVYNKYIFRGVASCDWELIPSALRPDNEKKICKLSGYISPTRGIKTVSEQIICEEILLWKFFSRCDYNGLKVPAIERFRTHYQYHIYSHKHLPDDFFEIAGLAQHYGIPTRLLDWSYNFYIALYFALHNAKNKDKYCSVWAFNLSTSSFFSHGEDKVITITPEYSQNPNLMAQKGVFTLWQINVPDDYSNKNAVDRRPLNELVESHLNDIGYPKKTKTLFYKINIPIKFKKDLLMFLSTIGYDGSTLFPGYDGITKSIKEFGSILNAYEIKK